MLLIFYCLKNLPFFFFFFFFFFLFPFQFQSFSGGNALLVGVGGSGRKSVTALASFISNQKLEQIELTKSYGFVEWREDIKRIMRKSGLEDQSTTFMLMDTQLVDEVFVEDINNLLNTGEVPNLFPDDEMVILQNPLGIFQKNKMDGILGRIDDKLNRIKAVGINDKTEDTVSDLIGYLIHLKIMLTK